MPSPALRHDFVDQTPPEPHELPAAEYNLNAERTDEAFDNALEALEREEFTTAEKTKLGTVQTGATANSTDAALRDRTTHVGFQPSTSISDLPEVVRDLVAAFVVQGANIVVTHDDPGDTLTIQGSAAGMDAEAVRDAIGAIIAGSGLVSVIYNDALDTITVATTATANSTDAALRDRSTHTGVQPISSVTDLQTTLDVKQPKFMVGTCATAGATAAKTVTLDAPNTAHVPVAGDFFLIVLTNGNTATNPTLAINGSTARFLRTTSGGQDNYSTIADAGAAVLLRYDGTYYRMFNPHTWYAEISAAEIINTAHSGLRTMTGRRAEDLMVNEATKARVFQNKTISGANNTISGLTSAAVTDFAEAAQDAVAAMLAQGTGITLSYNDAANTLTVTGTLGDPETIRDVMGVALVGSGLINIAVNDAGDTITFSTTATANSTDAALRDRSTHTGLQDTSTINNFTEAVQDIVGAMVVEGTGIDVVYNDAGNVVSIAATGGGGSLPSYSAPLGAVTADTWTAIDHGLDNWNVQPTFERSWLVSGGLIADVVRGEDLEPPRWRKVTKNRIEINTSEAWAANEVIVYVNQSAAAGDTTAPTAGVLSSPSQTATTINLSIAGAADAVGVAGIDIYRNGTLITTLAAGVTTYADTGRTPATAYTYHAIIFDLYGNPFQTNTITPSTAATPSVAYVTKGTAVRLTSVGTQLAGANTVNITIPAATNGLLIGVVGASNNADAWGGESTFDTRTLQSNLGTAGSPLNLTRHDPGVSIGPNGQWTGAGLLFTMLNPQAGDHQLTSNIDDAAVDHILMGQAFFYEGVGSLGTPVVQQPDAVGNLAIAVPSVAVGDMAFAFGIFDTAQATAFNQTIREAWGSNISGRGDFITAGDAPGAGGTINFTATHTGYRGGMGVRLIKAA